MMNNKYIGNELEIFEHAKNWKHYYGKFIKPYLKNDIAEVGAGIGGTTGALCSGKENSWLCIEPDPELIKVVDEKLAKRELPANCTTYCGTLGSLHHPAAHFDTIIYIDVIEHIEDDRAELENAFENLKPGGTLIILVPAHNKLFSPFDKRIGHFRRYNKQMLRAATPTGMKIEKLYYLDCLGYFASYVNKIFLKQNLPTLKQIKFWDRFMVPVSKISDKLLGFNFGKSVLLIAKKESP